MRFNTELAHQIAHVDSPRDEARYFAGREEEITLFKNGLQSSMAREQAIFRIYQGAPGCGKTALAAHLAETNENAVFIKVRHHHMVDFPSLMARVEDAASKQEGQLAATAVKWAGLMGARLTGRMLGEEMRRASKELSTEDLRFVLHVDEAHSLPDSALDVLKDLHIGGLGETDQIPCVVLLTGLAHTKGHVNDHSGLTRAGDAGTYGMSALTSDECAASTNRMLEELRCDRAPPELRQLLADETARWSFGWPRHLWSAHKAICEALLDAKGSLQAVSFKRIENRCAELRSEYYGDRLKDVRAPCDPDLTKRIVAQIGKAPPHYSHRALKALCVDEAKKLWQSDEDFDAQGTTNELMENGIVEPKDGVWSLSIPSMGAWAEQQLQRSARIMA